MKNSQKYIVSITLVLAAIAFVLTNFTYSPLSLAQDSYQ